MISFVLDRCSNYQHRTFHNIELSDMTLIFAIDLTTAGEKCTLNFCNTCEKKVFVFNVKENGRMDTSQQDLISEVVTYIKENKVKSINIAGNGIYTFNKHGISQERVNELVYNLLNYLIEQGCDIETIRSGGQTGADEAGLMAGDKLCLETICRCPKGWRFRNADGQDITSEEEFKARFGARASC